MQVADLTIAAINAALEKDQGALYRKFLGELMVQCKDPFNPEEEESRKYLGASSIGKDCARALWYNFRWYYHKKNSGRMVRLFNRGHLEEPRFVALLKMIGCDFWQFDGAGNQFRFKDLSGHFAGSMDGVVRGIPEMPGLPLLAEFKTHGEKSFLKLVAEGVLKTKWEHFIQMQVYMGKNKLTRALYMAVNKNTDELYAEIIQFDQMQYDRYINRAQVIVFSPKPPERINNNPTSWYACKFCDEQKVCIGVQEPERNCRTCKWSKPSQEVDNIWRCEEPNNCADFEDLVYLDEASQRAGCPNYQVIEQD